MPIHVKSPGFFTTIQDAGRFGYEKFGIPSGGPIDRFAYRAANLLVDNPANVALLEFCLEGPALQFDEDCLVALTGAGFELLVEGRYMPSWMAVYVRRGSQVQLTKTTGGTWGYLAVSGGILTAPVMGSRSTYVRGKLGGINGGLLQPGDELPIAPSTVDVYHLAGRCVPETLRPTYREMPVLDVVLGPQDDAFSSQGIATFLSSAYQVSLTSDRMGYRLEGAGIEHSTGADILSDGMSFGSVQVPASGQPIVMMSEHPTTGGYTKIATVVSADLPVLAQCTPGISMVSFHVTTPEAAQVRYRRLVSDLEHWFAGYEEREEYMALI